MSDLQEVEAAEVEVATPDQASPSTEVTTAPVSSDQDRPNWAQRIRDEQRLPAALRDRLAATIESVSADELSDEPSLTITQVAGLLAEAVPSLLSLDGPPAVAPHPGGEGFFRSGELSDRDASRIAAEQLKRTGFTT